MLEKQPQSAPHERNPSYLILTAETPAELQAKVSEKLHGATYTLVGQPFVFKDHICQAMAMRW